MVVALVPVFIFGAVTSLFVALFGSRGRGSSMESRMQDFRARAVNPEEDGVDLDLPFVERVLKPSVEGLARAISSILPASVLADLQTSLQKAGNPMKLNSYLTFWAISFCSLTSVGLLMFVAMPSGYLIQKLLFVLVLAAVGWIFPRMWLKGKVGARQKQVIRALPDAMDLITTCVEAGLGLDAALSRVAEKSEGPLSTEISKMLRDAAMGKLRRDAMQELADRLSVEELTSFINSIIQAEQLGVGIATVLRVQSEQMRVRRRQRAERSAHEAPIKMLFPLVLFIFPAFLGVILGPAAIRIAQSFSST